MDPKLAQLLAMLIPQVTGYIKAQLAEKGTVPTDEEIHATLTANEDAVTAISDAWLAAHPDA